MKEGILGMYSPLDLWMVDCSLECFILLQMLNQRMPMAKVMVGYY